MADMIGDTWYRYEDRIFSSDCVSESGSYYPNNYIVGLYCYQFKVIQETPKTVVLDRFGFPKRVVRDARKRFACPAKKEALQSFVRRKVMQKAILKRQLWQVEEALRLAAKAVEEEALSK